jgi:DNA-binding transcriptional LysR family regulator
VTAVILFLFGITVWGQDGASCSRKGFEPMDFRRLQYFLTVAQEGSFHRASTRLNIAQPALSRQVRELERDLDVQLFVRSTKGVRLSPAGEVLCAETERLLPQVDVARDRVKRAQAGQFGRVRIAFTSVAADSRFAVAAFAAARRAMPDVDFNLVVLKSEAQLKELSSDRLDIGLLYRRGPLPPDIAFQDLRTDSYLLAVPAGHHLIGRPRLKLADLNGEDFVFAPRSEWPLSYSEWMTLAQRGGLVPNIVLEAQSEAMFLNVVAEGLAIGFANSSLPQRRPFEGVVYLELEDLDTPLRLSAIWKRERETPPVRLFVDLLMRNLAARQQLRAVP